MFDTSVKAWNVNSLDNILNRIGVDLPGVNTPYLYFGMWKATFAWHVEVCIARIIVFHEADNRWSLYKATARRLHTPILLIHSTDTPQDMDLYSINYLHFGAPKQWYSIPSQYRQKFERLMQSIFFQEHKTCSQFLRHKTFIVSPAVLANHQIPVHRLVQHEGEFVITFPFGYHSGYNLGFNCAESVNFALSSWVQIGKKAVACQCVGDSVKIDVSIFEGREDMAREGGRIKKKSLMRIKLKDTTNEDTRTLEEEEEIEAAVLRSPTKQKRKRIKEGESEDRGETTGSEEALKKRGRKKSTVTEDSDMEAGTSNGKKTARRTSKVEIMVEKKVCL